jgi:flagellar protein FliS
MNANRALNAYTRVGTQSGVIDASPHRLISMLFEGAADRIASARGAMLRGERARQGELLGRVISIIDNLRASLDAERGGELAARLGDLYDYMQQRLLYASAESDVAALDEVRDLLQEVRSGWDAIPVEKR